MKLDIDLIARRQRELSLSRRAVATAMNVSLTRLTNLLEGKYQGSFTLSEVGRLADALACRPEDLLAREPDPADTSPGTDPDCVATVAALLQAAQGSVGVATLAKAVGTDLAGIESALAELEPALNGIGLALRRNTNDGSLSITAAIVSDERLQVVLRGEQARHDLSTNAAGLLYRIMTQRVTPRSVESNNDRRAQFGRLVNAGYITEPTRKTLPVALSDDVRESLLLDDR